LRRFGVIALWFVGCGGDRIDTIAGLTGDVEEGATLYATGDGTGAGCASCHAADGSGGTGPSLVDRAPDLDEDALITVIITGYGDMGPQAQLDDQEVADVVAYVRETFGGT
jgi:mono/diheme cytochrome c family protein